MARRIALTGGRRGTAWLALSGALVTAACAGEGANEEDLGSLQNDGLNPTEPDAGFDPDAPPDQVACESLFTRPPADCDPNVPESWNIDCDEDGSPGAQMTSCDPAQLLVHTPGSPPGRFDCDDRSADVLPGAVERWNDGLDSDCDGQDAPTCAAFEDQLVGTPADIEPGACDGSSLYFGGVVACPHLCDDGVAKVYFYLINGGGEPWLGDIAISYVSGDDGGELSIDGPLQPGAATAPLGVDYDPEVGLRLSVEAGDCSPGQVEENIEGVTPPCVR